MPILTGKWQQLAKAWFYMGCGAKGRDSQGRMFRWLSVIFVTLVVGS